jgi:large subunit ribosomal protein L25
MNTLKVKERQLNEKTRDLRIKGLVPGVLYGKTMESRPIMLTYHQLGQALREKGEVYTVKSKNRTIYVKLDEVQEHPVTSDFMHFSLVELPKGKRNEVEVPLRLIGDSYGVKEGGTLVIMQDKLKLEGLPSKMPSFVNVDVSHLHIADNIMLSDVKVPKGIKLLGDKDEVVCFLQASSKSRGIKYRRD